MGIASKIKCGKGSTRLRQMWRNRIQRQFPMFKTCQNGLVSQLQQKLALFRGVFIRLSIDRFAGNTRTGRSLVR
ncbi:MAG: hypothetical protein DMG85_21035 [Acidobacteria bacterium]|nr:MAG: hypothetical protein DMG85_21035 [Acidobacteriota bacterium]